MEKCIRINNNYIRTATWEDGEKMNSAEMKWKLMATIGAQVYYVPAVGYSMVSGKAILELFNYPETTKNKKSIQDALIDLVSIGDFKKIDDEGIKYKSCHKMLCAVESNFTTVPVDRMMQIMNDHELDVKDRLDVVRALAHIISYTNPHNLVAFPAMDTMVESMKINKKRLIDAIKYLEDNKILIVGRGNIVTHGGFITRGNNLYALNNEAGRKALEEKQESRGKSLRIEYNRRLMAGDPTEAQKARIFAEAKEAYISKQQGFGWSDNEEVVWESAKDLYKMGE